MMAMLLPSPLERADPAELQRLHDRLADGAAAAGVLDVAVTTLPSPVGELLLAATDAGLVRVAFPGEGHDSVLTELAHTVSPRVLRAPRRLDTVARELDEYFAGRRRSFDVALDWQLAHGFRREVLAALVGVPYAARTTYAQLARGAGRPRAVRAVGTACAQNPLPIVVPCHRVVRSDGSVGGYRGGDAAKRLLLDLEAAA